MIFRDRTEAGQILGRLLQKYVNRSDAVVLGLARGGVPVAYEIGKVLRAPLDVFVVRKLGVPGYDAQVIGEVSAREESEIRRREDAYRGPRPPMELRGKIVILADDGLATGATMRAAIAAVRQRGPARIVVAVPSGAPKVCREIGSEVDEIVWASPPESFYSISQWYKEFSQTTDDEVRGLLARASWSGEATQFSIPTDGSLIQGDLAVSSGSRGFVIFAHGSGSSRHSPRNKYVARILNHAGLATLLVDLLTSEEEAVDVRTSEHRFNIDLLASRLVTAIDWLVEHRAFSTFPVGLFGASTGAAAALVAAAERPNIVKAVVSRGGRPELAGETVRKVIAPTLFIVGESDQKVLELNRQAAKAMPGQTEIELIPGATHLFEEPGALEQVASLARQWFKTRLDQKQAA